MCIDPRAALSRRFASKTMNLRRKKNILLLIDTATGWGRNIVRGVDRYAREAGDWDLSIQVSSQVDYLPIPPRWKGDGVIARIACEKMAKSLKKANLPTVNISSISLRGCNYPRVISNFPKIGRMAAKHFIERGFLHFAFCAPEGPPYVHQLICEGYVAELANAGFECEILTLPQTPVYTARQQDALAGWLRKRTFPLAVFAWSVEAPQAIIRACHAAGILLPDEIAVVSSASLNELILQVINPAVSCVVTPETSIGYEAASLLDGLINRNEISRDASVRYVDPTHVEIRASSDVLQIGDASVVKAMRFMQKHAAEGIQVADVAAHAGLSRRALEQKMQRLMRRSPAEELRQIRLQIARECLERSSLSIPEVAERAGFGTVEHFIVFFKKATGLTPLQYAKKNRH